LPLLRFHALGDVADRADADGAAVVRQGPRADLDRYQGAVGTPGPMLVGLLGPAGEMRTDQLAVGGGHELLDAPAHEVGDLAAEDLGYLVVGVDELPGFRDRDPFEGGRGQAPESFLALVEGLVRAVSFDGRPEDGRRRLERFDLRGRPPPFAARLPEAEGAPVGTVREDGDGGEGARPQAKGEGLFDLGETADLDHDRPARAQL